MHNLIHASKFALVFAVALTCRSGVAAEPGEEFENWNLEPGVGQAHLVMVARVTSVSKLTVVEGAKTDVTLREYRFQPVRVLKGIFQRDELSMTASDLGLPAEDASRPPPLKEGEFRLLILAQQQRRTFGGLPSYGCVSAAPGATTFAQRVPLLAGADDPLVGVVKTLIKVADSRSRRERAKLLIDRLNQTGGPAAVPLLTSLKLRADWAAADGRAYASATRRIEPLAHDSSPIARSEALDLLREMLASRNLPGDLQPLDDAAAALRTVLESDEANTQIRVAAVDSLGYLFAQQPDLDWAGALLIKQLTESATYAERAAAARALSRNPLPQASGEARAVRNALADLPLDETPARESIYARAVLQFLPSSETLLFLGSPPASERVLLTRLKRSIAARQSLAAEIEALGQMRSQQCLSLLLSAVEQPSVSAADRQHIAKALGRLGDDRAVPVLIGWLRGNNYRLKEAALSALENLDSQLAAQAARPLLKSEPNLQYKLRIARLLARHGIDDGYALATEHLADDNHTAAAALALAALDDPRTADDLSEIIDQRPDRDWRAAALTGLAAIGDEAASKELLDILADDRHPLAVEAAQAVGLMADSELLLPLARLVESRNERLASASLVALRRYFSGVRTSPRGLAAVDVESGELTAAAPDVSSEIRSEIAKSVAALANDAYVDPRIRQEALAVARLLDGRRYAELLSNLADQAELEGTKLLAKVQAERRRLASE